VEAQYGCDKDGNEQVEFMPVSGGATQLGRYFWRRWGVGCWQL